MKKAVQDELKNNEELKQTIEKLKNDPAMQSASNAAHNFKRQAQDAANKASGSATAAASHLNDAANQAASKVKSAAESAASNAGADANQAHAESEAKKSHSEAGAGAASGTESEQGVPLYQRFFSDATNMFSSLKERLNTGATGTQSNTTNEEQSNAVVVKEPTFWERAFNFESDSAFGRMFGAAGDAAGGIGDRMFGETEQAEAMAELRQRMPTFSIDQFLADDMGKLAPAVLSAYLGGDVEGLRRTTRDQAYGALHRSVLERDTQQLKMDTRILFLSDPELESIRIIGGEPTPVVSFEAHQVNCVRHKLTDKIVEGNEDDIRAVHYLLALQPNEDEDAPHDQRWQVTELAVRGMQSVY